MTITDPLSYALEIFDKLILPNMSFSSSSTLDTMRRILYRKLYSEVAQKELIALNRTSFTVEDLVPLILSFSSKAGLVLI